jgi:hypothetical protein
MAKDPPAGARKTAESQKALPVLKKTADAEKVQLINQRLAEKWTANKLTPSARANDYEFLRRACLDIIGRLATPKEMEAFFKDSEQSRRALLIDRLLQTEDYANNWANIWTVWLMTRNGATDRARAVYHEQMHYWLKKKFQEEVPFKQVVAELLTATGKSNENGAVNYILAHLGEPNPAGEVNKEGKYTMVPVTYRTTRLFLGKQTQCAQCHPHPFNKEMRQEFFWGINAYFRQIDTPRGRPATANGNQMAMATVLELVDNPNLNPTAKVYFEERNGRLLATKPAFLLDPDLATQEQTSPGSPRRQELARFITESKFFSKAYVNRIWAHFFGRGFTNPVDDFGPENEVSHPELLDQLAADFAHYGYDPKRLIRWICNSDAYQLSCVANKTNEKSDAEPFFSRMLLKALTPEQLFESLLVATQASQFESKDKRREWMRNLTTNFGDDEGNEVTFNGTVVQALMMMNGTDIHTAITNTEKSTILQAAKIKRGNTAGMVDYLYKAALNRPATPRETEKILRIYRTAPTKSKDALSFWQDLFWALLNSNEFMLNH